MVEKSSRCAACVSRNRSCDGVLVASSLEKLLSQQRKLDAEESEASKDLVEIHRQMTDLQTQLSTALGRLDRIRKIRDRVKGKTIVEVQRSMLELDKEDGLLPALDSHEQFVVEDLQSMGVPNEVDWSTFGFENDFADLGPLVGPEDTGPERHSPPLPS
jgi:hypothetical protein